jgi:hypothetical protein
MKKEKVKSVILLLFFVLGFTIVYFLVYNHFDIAFYNLLDFVRNFVISFIVVASLLFLFIKKRIVALLGSLSIIIILLMPNLIKPWQEHQLILTQQKADTLIQKINGYKEKNGSYPTDLIWLKNDNLTFDYYLGLNKRELIYKSEETAYSISFSFYKARTYRYTSSNKQWRIED